LNPKNIIRARSISGESPKNKPRRRKNLLLKVSFPESLMTERVKRVCPTGDGI